MLSPNTWDFQVNVPTMQDPNGNCCQSQLGHDISSDFGCGSFEPHLVDFLRVINALSVVNCASQSLNSKQNPSGSTWKETGVCQRPRGITDIYIYIHFDLHALCHRLYLSQSIFLLFYWNQPEGTSQFVQLVPSVTEWLGGEKPACAVQRPTC